MRSRMNQLEGGRMTYLPLPRDIVPRLLTTVQSRILGPGLALGRWRKMESDPPQHRKEDLSINRSDGSDGSGENGINQLV